MNGIMMKTASASISLCLIGAGLFLSSPLDSTAQPEDAQAPIEVQIGVIPEALQFDQTEFSVQAGRQVTLTFDNSKGVMLHNLVITPPGKSETVAMAAINMGEEGPKRDYIPDSPLVLHATQLLRPGETQTLRFTAPTTPGDYDYLCSFPGHGFTMVGTMHVRAQKDQTEASQPRPSKIEGTSSKPSQKDKNYLLDSQSAPIFVRTFLPPSSPRAIAVGLPSGEAYCFDAADCSLLYAWRAGKGGFLNMEPVWNGRGGKPAKIVGNKFYKAPNICPIRLAHPEQPPQVEFRGYKVLGGIPELQYRVNGVLIKERITSHPTDNGLVRTFKIEETDRTIWYIPAQENGVETKISQGEREAGRIRIAPGGPVQFQIAISTD